MLQEDQNNTMDKITSTAMHIPSPNLPSTPSKFKVTEAQEKWAKWVLIGFSMMCIGLTVMAYMNR